MAELPDDEPAVQPARIPISPRNHQSCRQFWLDYARRLQHRRGRQGDTWYLDEPFVKIRGRQQYLWRAGFTTVTAHVLEDLHSPAVCLIGRRGI